MDKGHDAFRELKESQLAKAQRCGGEKPRVRPERGRDGRGGIEDIQSKTASPGLTCSPVMIF